MQFHSQLCFERFGIYSRTQSAEQIQEVFPRLFQTGSRSIDHWLGRQRQPHVRHSHVGQLGAIESRRSHANQSERMSVDLIAGADHRGIGAVLLAPDAVAHHRHGRRALLIVLVGHQSADPGLDTQGAEEIPGYIFPVASIDRSLRSLSTDAKQSITGL